MGSEMCIRDRIKSVCKCLPTRFMAAVVDAHMPDMGSVKRVQYWKRSQLRLSTDRRSQTFSSTVIVKR